MEAINDTLFVTVETPVENKVFVLSCPNGNVEDTKNVVKMCKKLDELCLQKFGEISVIREQINDAEEILEVMENQ